MHSLAGPRITATCVRRLGVRVCCVARVRESDDPSLFDQPTTDNDEWHDAVADQALAMIGIRSVVAHTCTHGFLKLVVVVIIVSRRIASTDGRLPDEKITILVDSDV